VEELAHCLDQFLQDIDSANLSKDEYNRRYFYAINNLRNGISDAIEIQYQNNQKK